MRKIDLLNKLIKSSRRWSKKTHLSFFNTLHQFFLNKKKEYIFNILDALNIAPEDESVSAQADKVVWVCWFQGIEQAPALVKRCIESIENNVGDAKVIVLNDDNIKDYITLPDYIIEKYQKGMISKAHYSDIVRCSLLSKYGGIWMDATVYLTKAVPEHLFHYGFSSLRFNGGNSYEAISQGYWTAYFLASKKNDPFIGMVNNIFYQYWQKHDSLVEYFLIDYALLYCIEKHNTFKEKVEKQPIIGNKRFYIRQFINDPLDSDTLEKLNQDPVGIYKLSHKERYREEKGSRPTLYSQIIENAFNLRS
jgi:Capsular polysaccharide synthesis protein